MKLDKPNKLKIGLAAAVAIILVRLFVIQIIDEKYKIDASNNSMVYSIIYPPRGIIDDRNGKILVGNKIAYDLLVTPKEVEAFDTLALCKALDIPLETVREKMQGYYRDRRRIGYQSVVMIKQMTPERYMKFAEIAYKFPGFRGQARNIREYPYNAGGNLLGYVSEVDADFIKTHEGYSAGDYAGKTGIEATCEEYLKGEKGYNIYLRNSHNKIESRYKDGEMDKEAVPGKNITTTIDAELQHYGQMLMQNKVGIQSRNRRGDARRHRFPLQRNPGESVQAHVQQGGPVRLSSRVRIQTGERADRTAGRSVHPGYQISVQTGVLFRTEQAGLP